MRPVVTGRGSAGWGVLRMPTALSLHYDYGTKINCLGSAFCEPMVNYVSKIRRGHVETVAKLWRDPTLA